MAPRSLPSPGPVDAVTGPLPLGAALRATAGLLQRDRHHALLQVLARQRALLVAESARRRVPFYRQQYGDRPFADLGDIPIVDKAAMRAAGPPDVLVAGPPPPGTRTQRTSGTTGVPFEALYSPRFARWQGLLLIRLALDRRLPPWWRRAALGFGGADPRRRPLALRLVDARVLRLPLDAGTAELAAAVAAYRPRVLSGHPHRVLDVGQQLEPGARPDVVTTHGETIDPILRASLTDTFGRPPLDAYGTSEVGLMAAQCRRADLYHVQIESVVLEVLAPDGRPVGPGGTGEVVVTGLHNALMPMVRYRLDDRATVADRPCACGYGGPALTAVVGRSADFATGAHGERISPERLWLYHHLDPDDLFRCIRRHQVHQLSSGEIQVKVELREALPAALQEEVLASYRSVAHGRPVSLVQVDDLGSEEPGKFRLFRSDVPWRSPQLGPVTLPVDGAEQP